MTAEFRHASVLASEVVEILRPAPGLLLAGMTAVLIILFNGDSHLLVPLFAVGAFLAFTLSQTGMVVRWWRKREPGWASGMVINGIGAITTCIVLFIILAANASPKKLDRYVMAVIPALARRLRAHHPGETEIPDGEVAALLGPKAAQFRLVVAIALVHISKGGTDGKALIRALLLYVADAGKPEVMKGEESSGVEFVPLRSFVGWPHCSACPDFEDNVIRPNGRDATCGKGRLRSGLPAVRMTNSTSVWVASDSTNQPVWKSSGVAWKKSSSAPNVRKS